MLKNRLKLSSAIKLYFALMIVALAYHALITAQIVDYKNAWGGRLENTDQMIRFELVSITIQIVFAAIIYVKISANPTGTPYKIARGFVFLIALIFLVNTAGNIVAIQLFERIVFTPLTLLASIASYRIAIE